MRAVYSELKRNLLNGKFWVGFIILSLACWTIGQPYVTRLLEAGYSAEGMGWFSAYVYCTTNEKALLFIPLLAPLAANTGIESELRSRFSLFCCTRVGKKTYFRGKTAGTLLAGGCMVCMSMLAVFGILFLRLRGSMDLEISRLSMLFLLIQSLLRGFFHGAFWALTGSLAAVVSKNPYLNYAAPIDLYYVLTFFQQRYYSTAFFLSPRYWAAPVQFGDGVCIGILCGLTAAASGLLLAASERRFAYA